MNSRVVTRVIVDCMEFGGVTFITRDASLPFTLSTVIAYVGVGQASRCSGEIAPIVWTAPFLAVLLPLGFA